MTNGMSRRGFMAGVVAAAAAAACSSGSDDADPSTTTLRPSSTTGATSPGSTATTAPVPDLPDGVFKLGVASGDPTPESVILWTRLAPEPLKGGGMPAAAVPLRWEVATTAGFDSIVASGVASATPTFAHSVHVDATGLQPDTTYHYRFTAGEQVSPVGVTRTAPAEGASVDALRFLFASCQNWTDGYWTAWPHAADEKPDVVLFLGDYIYEGGVGAGSVRQHNSEEIVSLDDYRNRYGLYKGDPGLQRMHAVAPWVVTWDDHEVENNYAGESSQDPTDGIDFEKRRAAAYQAFYEHHPVRIDPPDDSGDLVLYRTVDWGGLARFHVLDGRQYRTDQPCDGTADLGQDCTARHVEGTTMLGEEQEGWLTQQFDTSEATWNVIANQTIFTPLPLGGIFFNMDQWDGYPEARTRLLASMAKADLANPVIITGDIHASGVADVTDIGATDPIVATEFVGTSISSDFPPELASLAGPIIGALPHIRWFDATHRGYVVCDVTKDEMRVQYRGMATTAKATSPVSTLTKWVVKAGTAGAKQV